MREGDSSDLLAAQAGTQIAADDQQEALKNCKSYNIEVRTPERLEDANDQYLEHQAKRAMVRRLRIVCLVLLPDNTV